MSKEKVKKAIVYRSYARMIDENKLRDRFFVVEPEPHMRHIIQQVAHGVAKYVEPQAVVNNLLTHISNIEVGTAYELTHAEAVECVKFWMATTSPVKMPEYLGEKNSSALCFQRLSFNYSDAPSETPVLDEFMSRCTNADAIRQFVGSLTVETSSRFQYLWLFGGGGEGKGSFGRGLTGIFGSGAVTMTVPRSDGQKQFLAYSIRGRRLCIFPECSNFAFPSDPLFKQFTGGDHVWFEQKGKMGFSAPLNCKFIFFSNERAGVQGTDANTRRLIYSEISKPTVKYSSTIYDALISAEMPSFIIKCRELYLEKCPMNEDIQFNDEKTRELLDFNEERFEVLTEKWIDIGQDYTITAMEMNDIRVAEKLSNTEYRHWVEYMRTKFGIVTQVQRFGKKLQRKWVGIKIKPRTWVTGTLDDTRL